MSKPTLFIGIDGPILIPSENPEPYLRAEITDYAKPFVHWAKQNFDVRWLTDRNPRDGFYLNDKLSLPGDAVPVHTFDVSKIDVIEPHKDFYWVDAELIPHEITWLAQYGHGQRFIQVDPKIGVTQTLKEKLAALIRK